jgi:hypothetical protein
VRGIGYGFLWEHDVLLLFTNGLRRKFLAPQSGHVSNFCQPVGPVIEPVDAYCFQNDRGQRRCSFGLGTQAGHISNWPFCTRSPEHRFYKALANLTSRSNRCWSR